VNVVDVVLLVCIGLAAAAGFRLGFVTRVLSWIGMLAGVLISLVLLGPLLANVDPANHVRVTLLAIGLVVMGGFAGQAFGLLVGSRLRPDVSHHTLGWVDAVLGLTAGAVGMLLLIWLLVPVVTHRAGPVADEVGSSWLVRQLDERLPTPPDALQALRSIVGDDNFPDVFAGEGPSGPVGPPPASSGMSAATAEAVAASVVKVEGVACRKVQDGTGFVVSDDLLVTNAHVVAGERATEVIRNDGRRFDATVVLFDPDRDLALLHTSGLARAPLPLGNADVGDVGGVFGHPRGEPLRIAPFQVARFINAVGRNIYGTTLVERAVLEAAADLAPGDSGSPLVSPEGEVVGVTFAIARDRPGVAYALDTRELLAALAAPRGVVGTGACIAA
jgi:S1-C subfamily serine protease